MSSLGMAQEFADGKKQGPCCLLVETSYPYTNRVRICLVELPSEHDKPQFTNQMIIQAVQFWHESASATQQAVNEIAAEANLGKRLVFVPAPMKESNALFAGGPWLRGIKQLKPEDEVASV